MIKYRDWERNPEIHEIEGDLFVTKDKNGKDVFDKDEVLVYRGNKNIGEGHVFFNERFLCWTVNNSSQDNDRESPQDWSQLSLCDVEIELIEDKENE